MADEQQATLRDTVEAAFDEHMTEDTGHVDTAPVPAAAPAEEAAAQPETAAQSADRARGPDGKFIKSDEAQPAESAPAAVEQPVVPAAPPVPRPSSWKKDYEPHWQKIASENPDLARYLQERESQFASGVSTYKNAYDQVKPVAEAMQPFLPHLQQAGIQPDQWIHNLGNAHLALAQGTPEQKLGMFLKLAQDYKVPVQQLFQQQDGQVYFNPQVQPYQPPVAQQPQPDVRSTVQEILMQERAQQSLAEFERDVPTKYQHYQAVKEDMALLLETGKARDYQSAYEMALRLNDDLWKSQQDAQRKAAEAARQQQSAEAAQRARRNSVSPRSATPTAKPAPTGKRDVRSTIEAAFDEVVEASRV